MKNNRNQSRNMNFESMEKREMFTADLGLEVATPPPEPQMAIYVKIPGIPGDVTSEATKDDSAEMRTTGWDNIMNQKWTDVAVSPMAADTIHQDAKSFVADSFSFGVEREMKESGEKGGTQDMNIGIGELQECTISKSMDSASGELAR